MLQLSHLDVPCFRKNWCPGWSTWLADCRRIDISGVKYVNPADGLSCISLRWTTPGGNCIGTGTVAAWPGGMAGCRGSCIAAGLKRWTRAAGGNRISLLLTVSCWCFTFSWCSLLDTCNRLDTLNLPFRSALLRYSSAAACGLWTMTPFTGGCGALSTPPRCNWWGVLWPLDGGEEAGDRIMHGMDGAHTMSSASVMLPSLRRFSFSSSPSVPSKEDLETRFSLKSSGDDDWTVGLFGSGWLTISVFLG